MRAETFQHLLCILVRNALDWLHGRRRPLIRITVRSRGEQCEVVVADNGPGIKGRIAGQVFDPLVSSREGAHGMGLAVARALVEAHGGKISVIHDGRRAGAALRILLPRKRARATVTGS
jgi:C4-dicarboxylate-specific signal transduction histidine kinase